jgi:putative hydrolase of the HAD superfamily
VILLLDYGGVLTHPIDEQLLTDLAGRLRVEAAPLRRRFHAGRPAFDHGQEPAAYWQDVAARALTPDELADAQAVDLRLWSDVAVEAVTATRQAAAAGLRLALLSNMPHPEADAYESLPWTEPFSLLLFSCRLGLLKPDPAIFRAALEALDTAPADVVFLDDRTENVAAARLIGIDAHVCPGPQALVAAVQRLTTRPGRPVAPA